MPYRVSLSTCDPFGLVELSGVVSWTELGQAFRALYLDPRWAPGADALWDARAVTGFRLTPGEVSPDAPSDAASTMAELASARAGGRAAVVTRDLLVASLARVLAELGPPTGRVVKTFPEVGDALAFLGREAVPEGWEVVASAPPARPTALGEPPLGEPPRPDLPRLGRVREGGSPH